jgi:hypothetical protein
MLLISGDSFLPEERLPPNPPTQPRPVP